MRFAHPMIRSGLPIFPAMMCGLVFAFVLVLSPLADPAVAERQSAMNLFPHDTLVFLRTANAKEFADKLKETGTGRLFADPQIKPIVDRVLGQVSALYSEQAEGEVGLAWNEILQLPKGELAFGVIARAGAFPGFLLLLDQGGEPSVARALLDRALVQMTLDGAEITTETIDGVEVTISAMGAARSRVVGFFEKEGTIIAANDPNLLRHVIHHWDGTKPTPAVGDADAAAGGEGEFVPGPGFNTNQKLIEILSKSRRPSDPPPNLIAYIDPIGLARHVGRANPGVQIALAFLPQLGLDGLQAIGGTLTVSTGPFDSLTHLHILLNNPRAGVFSMLTFESGDNAPPAWVPLEMETYMTGRWSFKSFYARLRTIVDGFRGEGFLDGMVTGGVSQQLGVDFNTQILDNLAGRITLVAGFETPVRLQGRHNVVAIEVNDEAAAQQTLQTVMSRQPELFERKQFGRATYYALKTASFGEFTEEERPFNPFVAVFEKNLFVGTSTNLFERIVSAGQGEIPRLAGSRDYSRVESTLNDATAGVRPAVFLVQRPELTWKFWYELLQKESTRELIDRAAADNEVIERFAAILREGGLPPFESLQKYFAPGGGVIYDTNNGFHGVSFGLRNE